MGCIHLVFFGAALNYISGAVGLFLGAGFPGATETSDLQSWWDGCYQCVLSSLFPGSAQTAEFYHTQVHRDAWQPHFLYNTWEDAAIQIYREFSQSDFGSTQSLHRAMQI